MPNRLADSTSPYLQQHADNPVAWWPWGEDAFAEARRRDLPVFVSIGYAACHWCHVMAHESFEDPQVADLLNKNFVAVKVDREERPDVDAVYMNATTALTGQGGWPMSVFCTPDGKPFYAGTYFPPYPAHGRPSFAQVLTGLAEAWRTRRGDVAGGADAIVSELAKLQTATGLEATVDVPRALEVLGHQYDEHHAGFGGAPKFPPTMVLDALAAAGDANSLRMLDATLAAMANGGIHDQLAGGFARYSVDQHWSVPHFEKMLYDNALLLGTYARRFGRTGNRAYAGVVRRMVDWLNNEMRTEAGAYASSLDADSLDHMGHSVEGAFYVWTPAGLSRFLGEDADWAAAAYSVTEAGTFEHGTSTLQRLTEVDEDKLESVRSRLLAARAERPRPGRDDKVIAAWNGWLIDSLATAAMIMDERSWLEDALAAAEHLWQTHWVDGRLCRASREGVVGDAPGVLEDYGGLAQAYARLAAATADPRWLRRAESLLEVVEARFGAPGGGFFDTAADAEALFVRPRDVTDNATPSGTSTTIVALRLLGRLTGEPGWSLRADQAAAASSELVERAPRFTGWLLRDAILQGAVFLQAKGASAEIAVIGSDAELVRTAWALAPEGSVVVARQAGEDAAAEFAVLQDRTEPGAYVCRDFVCQRPVHDAAALGDLLG